MYRLGCAKHQEMRKLRGVVVLKYWFHIAVIQLHDFILFYNDSALHREIMCCLNNPFLYSKYSHKQETKNPRPSKFQFDVRCQNANSAAAQDH